MREIKFRAWDGEEIIYYNNWFTLHENTVLCFEEREKHSYVDASDVDYPVRVNLMQFTGLLDKNGKEIYEGDIVSGVFDESGVKMCGVVFYDYDGFKMKCVQHMCDKDRNGKVNYFSFIDYDGDILRELEVIGNIYESPELLK